MDWIYEMIRSLGGVQLTQPCVYWPYWMVAGWLLAQELVSIRPSHVVTCSRSQPRPCTLQVINMCYLVKLTLTKEVPYYFFVNISWCATTS